MISKQELGDYGEKRAAQYYCANGFQIIAKNYRCKHGEIDLLCFKKDKLYSIEVKTRTSTEFGHPEEAVTKAKQDRIQRCTANFISNTRYKQKNVIYHVCSIFVTKKEDILRIYTF